MRMNICMCMYVCMIGWKRSIHNDLEDPHATKHKLSKGLQMHTYLPTYIHTYINEHCNKINSNLYDTYTYRIYRLHACVLWQ